MSFPELADYIQRGLHVLRLNGKHPDGKHAPNGVHSAACSDKAWSGRFANVGIAIDVGPLEGVRVLDIDPKNGGSLESLPGELPLTPSQRTGSGGWHFLFRWFGGRPKTKLLPGVELLGPGRYFVAAPSIHPRTNEAYAWTTSLDTPIADAPSWLVSLATEKPRAPRKPVRDIGNVGKYARAALIDAINRVERAGDGARNDTLFKETAAIARFSVVIGDELIANAMIDAAVSIGLKEREAEKTVMSALRRRQ